MPAHKAGIALSRGAAPIRPAWCVGHNGWQSFKIDGLMRVAALFVALVLATACGDKVPQSKAVRELGSAPKQAIDRASTGADKAIEQGVERLKDADEKQ